MLLIPCPYCGLRPELEFSYGGQAHLVRPGPQATAGDAAWTSYQYERSNDRGPHAERWRHVHGCARFFNVVRDTTTDRIIRSYKRGES